ncbi:MAG: hypothetical protein ACOY3O_09170 [Thermodesulfobacteriota bacterium]
MLFPCCYESINHDSAMTAATLPLIHRDPFDPILIAEAMRNGLTILTKDRPIPRYGVPPLW